MNEEKRYFFESWAVKNGADPKQVIDMIESEKRIFNCSKFIQPALKCPNNLSFGGEYLNNLDKYDSDNDQFCKDCNAFDEMYKTD